tara:strand:- start:2420 stop:2890 length:471 start_codon:yes stop_codon:yes gene_type:complete
MGELEVEIFTLPTCPACKRLKTSLDGAGVNYTEKETKEYADEWTNIQEITKTYYLPTIKVGDIYFSPNRDFKNDKEALELIEKAVAGEIVEHEMSEIELRETMKTLMFQLEMINKGMSNFGRQLYETREFVRMPNDWKPEPPKQPNTPPVQNNKGE